MANEKRLIDANAYCKELYEERDYPGRTQEFMDAIDVAIADLCDMPTVDAVEVVHGQRLYNAHEVAEIIADILGDPCACNFNSIDAWLPFKCELQAACPNPVGVACWEQYLKYRGAKMDGERKDNDNA